MALSRDNEKLLERVFGTVCPPSEVPDQYSIPCPVCGVIVRVTVASFGIQTDSPCGHHTRDDVQLSVTSSAKLIETLLRRVATERRLAHNPVQALKVYYVASLAEPSMPNAPELRWMVGAQQFTIGRQVFDIRQLEAMTTALMELLQVVEREHTQLLTAQSPDADDEEE